MLAPGILDGTMKRYLSIWLPDWSIERIYRKSRQTQASDASVKLTPSIPFALTTSAQGGIRITAANDAAKGKGIFVDQRLASAKALCPILKIRTHDPSADAEGLNRLAHWCIRYSPWVNSDPPDGILIDITGCAHLVGGEDALCKDIQKRLRAMDLKGKMSIADTIGAAWAVSRFGCDHWVIIPSGKMKNALAPLPIAALRVRHDAEDRLAKVGLKNIGKLIDKPRAPLAARYGKFLIDRLDQALGYKGESLSPIAEPPDYRIHQNFMEPILMLDQLQQSLSQLASALSRTLNETTLGARQFALFLYRVDGDVKIISVRTSSLSNKPDHITRLLSEKLSALSGDYDVGFGIEKVILAAYHTERITHFQINLDKKKENGSIDEFQALIDRYGNRLGFENVGKFHPIESYIPERCEHFISVTEEPEKSNDWRVFLRNIQGGNYLGRPIVLLPKPEQINAIAEVPDGPPIHFEWRRLKYRIVRAEGPERLAPEWWLPAAESKEPTRDYFRVEDHEGGRFWLFRQGLFEQNEAPKWYMHGFFA